MCCYHVYISTQILLSPFFLIWRSGDCASWYMFIIKPTTCTNFHKFIFGIKLSMSRTVPLSIIRNFSLYTKHVEFYSKDKFIELVQLVGFIIRIVTFSIPCIMIQLLQFKTTNPHNFNKITTILQKSSFIQLCNTWWWASEGQNMQ